MSDLRLNTLEGCIKVIETLIKTKPDKPNGLMRDAFIAMCDLIDQHGASKPGVSDAMRKVRLALDLPAKKGKANDSTSSS